MLFATSSAEIRFRMSESNTRTFKERGEELQQRRRATNQAKRGVDYPMSDPSVRVKSITTCNERFGCDNPSQNEDVKRRIQETCLKRFGVRSVFQRPDVRAAVISKEVVAKRHLTMKKNGSYRKSKPEDSAYEILCKQFGTDNVDRNVVVNDRWPIDFYVRTIETYIQVDGVYWHRLY